jgi:hypothetical protein
MQPLTIDDLIPLEEFASKRREFFESHRRYLDLYRRVRVGPSATLVFENRQTLWFRVQEMLRIARLASPVLVQRELDLCNRLLPFTGQLQAALLIEMNEESQLAAELATWANISGHELRLLVGSDAYESRLTTCRPEDRTIGVVHWVQFAVDDWGHQQLADARQPAYIEISLPNYSHRSPLLSPEIRESLCDDLQSSKNGSPVS